MSLTAATIRRSYVDGTWGQVHVRMTQGRSGGTPLLLLHPTPKSGWIYEGLMQNIGSDRTALAPDTPGYGASDAPPAPASIEDFAGEMIRLADQLVTDGQLPAGPIDVLGYHTGSVIATAMARLYPDKVRRLVLVSLAAYDAPTRQQKRENLKNWRGPTEDGSHLTAMWQLMQSLFDPRIDAEWKHASLTENLRPGCRAPWGYDAVYRYDFQEALDDLTHRTLILNPEDDLWQPTRDNYRRVRNADYVELPGLGHGLFDLETDRIAGLVRDFLNG